MSQGVQEWIAFGIVFIVALNVLRSFVLSLFGDQIARYLLKKGRVKWAMRFRRR